MRTIKVAVPRSTRHALTKVRVRHSQGESETEVDPSHLTHVEIHIPDDVPDHEVEIVGEYCDARGIRDEGMDIVPIKSATEPPDAPKNTDATLSSAAAEQKDEAVTQSQPVVVADAIEAPAVADAAQATVAPEAPAVIESAPLVDAPVAPVAAVVDVLPKRGKRG